MSKSHITTAASTTLLVSPGTEGLDLLGVKEPEDEILHQPRPRTVTTTPTTPTTPATLRKRTEVRPSSTRDRHLQAHTSETTKKLKKSLNIRKIHTSS